MSGVNGRLVSRSWLAAAVIVAVALTVLLPARRVSAQDPTEVWSEPVNLFSSWNWRSWLPRLADDDAGNVHVIWADAQPSRGRIMYTMWDGESWSGPIPISTASTEIATLPSIAVDGWGMIHVVYVGGQGRYEAEYVYYTCAYAGGRPWLASSWSYPLALGPNGGSYWTDVAVDGEGNVHVIWQGSGNERKQPDIWYARWSEAGRQWEDTVNLSNTADVLEQRPRISVSVRQTLHAVWLDTDVGHAFGVSYATSLNGGRSWSTPSRIMDWGNPVWPNVVVDGKGQVLVTYRTTDLVMEQGQQLWFYSRKYQLSGDGGLTWSEPSPLGVLPDGGPLGGWGWGDMPVDSNGVVHFISDSVAGGVHGWWNGSEWSPFLPAYYAVNEEYIEDRPRAAIGLGNRLHVVWSDVASGSDVEYSDIFYTTTQLPAPALPARSFVLTLPTPATEPRPVVTATIRPPARPSATLTLTPRPAATPSPPPQAVAPLSSPPMSSVGAAYPVLLAVGSSIGIVALSILLAFSFRNAGQFWRRLWRRMSRMLR